jgi:chemotaxis protein histidine kinase CheA
MPLFDSFGSLFVANPSVVNSALYIGVAEVLSGSVSINSAAAAPTPATPVVQHTGSVSPPPCARLPRCKDPCSANTRKSIQRLIASVRRARGVSKTSPKASASPKKAAPKPLSPVKKVSSPVKKLLSIVAKKSPTKKASPLQKLVKLVKARSASPKKPSASPKQQMKKLQAAIRNLRSVSPVIKAKPKVKAASMVKAAVKAAKAACPSLSPAPKAAKVAKAACPSLSPAPKAAKAAKATCPSLSPKAAKAVAKPPKAATPAPAPAKKAPSAKRQHSEKVLRDAKRLIRHLATGAPGASVQRDLNRLARDFGVLPPNAPKRPSLPPAKKALVQTPAVQRDTAKLVSHLVNGAPKAVISRDLNRLAKDFGVPMKIKL